MRGMTWLRRTVIQINTTQQGARRREHLLGWEQTADVERLQSQLLPDVVVGLAGRHRWSDSQGVGTLQSGPDVDADADAVDAAVVASALGAGGPTASA